MRVKTLNPVKPDNQLIEELENNIIEILLKFFYRPLIKTLGEKKLIENSEDSLVKAIRKNKLKYHQGVFSGKFNATVSKSLRALGAKWDRSLKGYRIPLSSLPKEVQDQIRVSEFRFNKKVKSLDDKLSQLSSKEIVEKMSIDKFLDKTIFKLDKDIEETLDFMTVQPKFSKESKERIQAEYKENLELNIKQWMDDEVLKLRRKVNREVLKGNRYETLVDSISKSYGVSKSKAQFLARQETNLLTSKMRELRYGEAGITKYIWKNVVGSPNHPVRDSHKKLNNKVFEFSNPPEVNEKGERKNPGEDYNCRCTAHPVVVF